MSEYIEIIAQRARDRRQNLGLSMRQVAERSGLSLAAVWSVESKRRKPQFETIAKLSKGLAVGLDYWEVSGL